MHSASTLLAPVLHPRAEDSLRTPTRSLWPAVLSWVVAVAVGWVAVSRYDLTTEQPLGDDLAAQWPADSEIVRPDDLATILLFLHPKCPCSRASLTELERLTASLEGQRARDAKLIVVVTTPESPSGEWLKTATVARASRLRNGTLFVDRGGVEAKRFGAVTSGLVMLYDGKGTCRYAGGVTIARGHEGENGGRLSLLKILEGDLTAPAKFPAFGCRLCLPERTQPPDRHATKAAHALGG